jgi:hypothetical protein
MEDVGDEMWKNIDNYVAKFREYMKDLSPEEMPLA